MSTTAGIPEPAGLRVLLIDDHRVLADVLRLGLDRQPDLYCVGVAHSAAEGLARAAATGYDVALVDLDLPDSKDLALVEKLLRLRPAGRVLVLTAFARPNLVRRARELGVAGFLGKDSAFDTILDAVRTATVARPAISTDLELAARASVELTPREHDVLRLLGTGHDAGRIADELGISMHTTRGYIKALLTKLGTRSQLGAVVEAERLGLLTIGQRQ